MLKNMAKKSVGIMMTAALLLTTVASTISVSANTQIEYKPIASYNFSDATNPGKDSVGNHNLMAYYQATDNGDITEATSDQILIKESGNKQAIDFNGKYWLAGDNFTQDLKEMTFSYWIKESEDSTTSGKLQGTAICTGAVPNSSAVNGIRLGYNGGGAYAVGFRAKKADDTNPEVWLGDVIAADKMDKTKWAQYIVTIQLADDSRDGSVVIYRQAEGDFTQGDPTTVNLSKAETKPPISNTNLEKIKTMTSFESSSPFAIGASLVSLSERKQGSSPNSWKMSGMLSDVRVYDKAFNIDEVKELFANGKVMTESTDEPIIDTEEVPERPEFTEKELRPVARYDFNDAENLGKDSVGNHDLKIYGLNQLEDKTLAKQASGPWNDAKALDFDGSYYLSGDNFTKNMTEMTVTFWTKQRTNGDLRGVVASTGCVNSETSGIRIGHSTGTKHNIFFGYAGVDADNNKLEVWGGDRGDFMQGEVWTRYALVFKAAKAGDAGSCELYIIKNGKYIPGDVDSVFGAVHYESYQSKAWDPKLNAEKIVDFGNATADLVLGAALGTNGELLTEGTRAMFNGRIADVRIYDRALSDVEAIELFAVDAVTYTETSDGGVSGDEGPNNSGIGGGTVIDDGDDMSDAEPSGTVNTGDHSAPFWALAFLLVAVVCVLRGIFQKTRRLNA